MSCLDRYQLFILFCAFVSFGSMLVAAFYSFCCLRDLKRIQRIKLGIGE